MPNVMKCICSLGMFVQTAPRNRQLRMCQFKIDGNYLSCGFTLLLADSHIDNQQQNQLSLLADKPVRNKISLYIGIEIMGQITTRVNEYISGCSLNTIFYDYLNSPPDVNGRPIEKSQFILSFSQSLRGLKHSLKKREAHSELKRSFILICLVISFPRKLLCVDMVCLKEAINQQYHLRIILRYHTYTHMP